MRVLMLGWEFPPFISGGLGTACYGLTRALSRQDVDVLFVLPKSVDSKYSTHVKLLSPDAEQIAAGQQQLGQGSQPQTVTTYQHDEFERVIFKAVPARITNPYQTPAKPKTSKQTERDTQVTETTTNVTKDNGDSPNSTKQQDNSSGSQDTDNDYSADIVTESQRYANLCVQLSIGEEFDVIHAHDWMTFPAGLAIARISGKPLVVQVHSTEFDRTGETVFQPIYDIERRGMHGAMTVICVSYLTRNICVHRYGIPADKVQVVYNGIDSNNGPTIPQQQIEKGDKIVLFLGRITMQKGPEYFVAAAKKVLEKMDNVKFVMAGSGDKVQQAIRMSAEMGIGHKVLFTGFLRGKDVQRIFNMADVYVMPSVSEPFGIAPLEAIRHDVPVIISRNSGVAEVLQHALKVDFWDVDDIANKIIAVLKHPPLSQTLREHADMEVRALTWDGAATRCIQTYQQTINAMQSPPTPPAPTVPAS